MGLKLTSTVDLLSGNAMPVMGLGTWQLNHETADTIAKAIELGYPMIDTSGDYGTQPGIGKGIKKSGVHPSNLYIVTKVEEIDDAYEAVEENLRQLELDSVDLVLIHRPPDSGAGEELWEGLLQAKADGLTTDIGVSNYPIAHIETLIKKFHETPVVNQVEWSPFGYDQKMLEYCNANDIVIQAYSPLTRTERLGDALLTTLAARYQKSPAQILIRWNLQLGTVPIVKANSVAHLEEDIDVFDFELSVEDMNALSSLNEGYSAL